jgi:O-antigen/teichoic acid export membrane protein
MAVNYAVVPLLAIVLFGSSAASILVAMGAGWVLVSLVALVRLPMTVKDFGLRIKELARFGIPRVPGDVLQLSLFAAPGILVAHASDIRVAGIVAFGIAALGMIGSGLTPVSFVLLPFAARMFAAGSITKLRIWVLQVAALTLGTTLVVVILLELFAGTLVSIYLGPSFAAGADVLRLTLIAALPWGVYITLRSVIDAKHVQAINARNMIITFAVFVVATFALRSAVDTVTGPILAFVLSLNVLAALTLFEVYRITRTGDSDRVPTAVEPDFTIG